MGPDQARADGGTAGAPGVALAQVVNPLLVVREHDLVFGTVFAGQASGSVTVTPSARTFYGGGVQSACLPATCTPPHPAAFRVQGEAGRSYHVGVPDTINAAGNLLDGGGSAAGLVVQRLTVETASRPGSGGNGVLDAVGVDRFTIGATLLVPGSLPAASYRATVPVIVTYG